MKTHCLLLCAGPSIQICNHCKFAEIREAGAAIYPQRRGVRHSLASSCVEINSLMTSLFGTPAALLGRASGGRGLDESRARGEGAWIYCGREGKELLLWDEGKGSRAE